MLWETGWNQVQLHVIWISSCNGMESWFCGSLKEGLPFGNHQCPLPLRLLLCPALPEKWISTEYTPRASQKFQQQQGTQLPICPQQLATQINQHKQPCPSPHIAVHTCPIGITEEYCEGEKPPVMLFDKDPSSEMGIDSSIDSPVQSPASIDPLIGTIASEKNVGTAMSSISWSNTDNSLHQDVKAFPSAAFDWPFVWLLPFSAGFSLSPTNCPHTTSPPYMSSLHHPHSTSPMDWQIHFCNSRVTQETHQPTCTLSKVKNAYLYYVPILKGNTNLIRRHPVLN